MPLCRRSFLAALAALTLPPARLAAQPVPQVVDYPLFETPPATHRLAQTDLRIDGLGYRIFTACPLGQPPAAGWPSLWMLDGNAAFSRLNAADLAAHPGLAVVGIGYPVDTAVDARARSRDYTPPVAQWPEGDPAQRRPTGGDAAFRARLLGPIAGAVAQGMPLDPAARTLWGHSYGGLFVLGTLFATPEAFRAYVAVSPSTHFGGGALAGAEARARARTGAPARLLIQLGDREYRRGTEAPATPRPAPQTMALAERLARRADLVLELEVFEGLGHGATFAASFPRAFAVAQDGDQPPVP
ncbi:alpha/beta hydrolase [Salipiger marinus]|uniref:Diacylglycerol O-acyltransferase n=1 Tax=Salipiger marinus TaxID=555512 RepID=A0A1G8IRG9_9RHOB|nr:alpha/beta hydrolase-fold protein [Salipiger marinus]SDI21494.1 hypothetical protein SAMN04487993_100272 [Salipiger marinus]